jgi:hypothetical protein
MSATLAVTRKTIGVEVRRGPYDVFVDGERVGSVALHETFEMPLDVGHHTLQVRGGRNSSRTQSFDAGEDEVVAFRSGGKKPLPLFLASLIVPSLALSLTREF